MYYQFDGFESGAEGHKEKVFIYRCLHGLHTGAVHTYHQVKSRLRHAGQQSSVYVGNTVMI